MGVILPAQLSAQRAVPERVRRAIYDAITPWAYPASQQVGGLLERHAPVVRAAYESQGMAPERFAALHTAAQDHAESRALGTASYTRPELGYVPGGTAFSEDAWAMYLGLPQPFGSIRPSPYTPTTASGVPTQYFTSDAIRRPYHDPRDLRSAVHAARGGGGKAARFESGLANHQVSLGSDDLGSYLALYDTWDFGLPAERLVGAPFEVYDRIYYDPKTFRAIPPEVAAESRRRLDLLRGLTGQRSDPPPRMARDATRARPR